MNLRVSLYWGVCRLLRQSKKLIDVPPACEPSGPRTVAALLNLERYFPQTLAPSALSLVSCDDCAQTGSFTALLRPPFFDSR